MSLTLVEALGQVDLQEGHVYRCHVNGHWVEVRVRATSEDPKAAGIDDSDVMLDPWVELPAPTSGIFVRARLGALPLPDPPEIPRDEDEE
jgi:hypothetical protein